MQPYFFPYFEHFRLLAACDLWIAFDTVAYRRKTWMTRNRILNRDTEWSWLSVPVSPEGRDQPVSRVRIADHLDWRSTIADKLGVYRTHAPHDDSTMELVESILAPDFETLTDLNVSTLERIGRLLGIDTPIERLSRMDLDLPPDPGPGEWALFIAEAVGADEYRNPSGGRHLFDPHRFDERGIELSFHDHIDLRYDTGPFGFVPGLSILDTLMWMDVGQLRRLL